MSTLSFEVNLGSENLKSLDLPVEIRKPNLALVQQATTAETVTVEPGTYYVTARTPAGQELITRVKVSKGRRQVVRLSPDPEDESPQESQAARHFLGGISSDLTQIMRNQPGRQPLGAARGTADTAWSSMLGGLRGLAVERLGPADTLVRQTNRARLRLFEGNVLTGSFQEVTDFNQWGWKPSLTPPNRRQRPGEVAFRCAARNNASWLQLLQPNSPAVNVALPTSTRQGCEVVIAWLSSSAAQSGNREWSSTDRTDGGGGLISIDVRLENLTADALLRYLARGRLDEAGTMVAHDSPALISEELLYGKVQDPIAATVGAYTLLRTGNIERLHNWTENLKNWFPWLPDGLVVRAEHLACLGKHDLALAQLLTLPTRGLPLFSDGLTYAINRLRFYATLARQGRVEADSLALDDLMERLLRVAAVTDFRRPILTFTGLNLTKPDDEPVTWEVVAELGVDVGQWLTPGGFVLPTDDAG